jgi:hypothetical protein
VRLLLLAELLPPARIARGCVSRFQRRIPAGALGACGESDGQNPTAPSDPPTAEAAVWAGGWSSGEPATVCGRADMAGSVQHELLRAGGCRLGRPDR